LKMNLKDIRILNTLMPLDNAEFYIT
jgi:hypothetical protein